MGFMDRFKGQMDQAQQVQQAGAATMGAGAPDASQADYAQLGNKLAASGVPCTATIISIEETGKTDISGKEHAIVVNVEGNGEPYEATIRQYLISAAMPSYVPGARFEAKADPDARERLLLFGPAS